MILQTLQPKDDTPEGCGPPYVLSDKVPPEQPRHVAKKRRREQMETASNDTLEVSTYKLPNMGPYPVDKPRTNNIKFTPAQVEAIRSGTNPGLTVIVGPPGTGKTDVATQIISNLYHNFPQQRTLLIAHSNQALNQLFEKITALDIDERHLLRLGHGEEDLKTDTNYSKQGRVESFMVSLARVISFTKRGPTSNKHLRIIVSGCSLKWTVWLPVWELQVPTATPARPQATSILSTFYQHGRNSKKPSPKMKTLLRRPSRRSLFIATSQMHLGQCSQRVWLPKKQLKSQMVGIGISRGYSRSWKRLDRLSF